MNKIKWQTYYSGTSYISIERMKVPGGWLVRTFGEEDSIALCFYPDPAHLWEIADDKK